MHARSARAAGIALAICLAAAPVALGQTRAVTLEVDAREAARKIFHARLTIPSRPGPLTLLYPKWLPGEHGPTGPIADVAGLKITTGGKPLVWRRDPVEMYAIAVEVPAGAAALEVTFDYLSPASAGGFSSSVSVTPKLALVSWNQVLLYPAGASADELLYAASLRLPPGWKYGTALTTSRASGELVSFEPVPLTTLVDSPVLAGPYFKVVSLSDGPIPHRLDLAADSEAALEIPASQVDAYRRLVAETGVLFGARHYRHYDFLLTLSDSVAHFGLEHHESSDDRVPERSLIEEDKRKANLWDLLSHEMVHSWNGKYRRPASLSPGHFDQPMKGELLWVYEGLTQYLGEILAPRSGLLTSEEYRDNLAITAAEMDAQKGRSWRPLSDTAVAAQVLYEARPDWAFWRRGVDFYPESSLLWLEADTVIRKGTGGQKKLDDFCRIFLGGQTGPPQVVPYGFDDVVSALNQVFPYDWKGFWTQRLDATAAGAPLAGVGASGWRLVYTDKISEMLDARESSGKFVDARFSIGFLVSEDGAIPDVVPESPAARSGMGPGMRVVAVNGRRFSKETFREAVRASRTAPIELLVENGDFFRTFRLEYSGGERYPHLERDPSAPDLLSAIIAPRSK
jgi:predicted metalloprotease with PDZ domain